MIARKAWIAALSAIGMFSLTGVAPAQAQEPNLGIEAGPITTFYPDRPYYGRSTPSPLPAYRQLSSEAKSFIMKAGATNLAEIRLGRMAQERGSSQEVKDFGHHMIEEHTKAQESLKNMAEKVSFEDSFKIDAKHQAVINKLSKLRGAAFDRAYAMEMVKGHKAAVKMFEARANSGRGTDVRAWAASMAPDLRKHLEHAQGLYKSVHGVAWRDPSEVRAAYRSSSRKQGATLDMRNNPSKTIKGDAHGYH
jgi:putative membrane protein